jgi:hypothetical protein
MGEPIDANSENDCGLPLFHDDGQHREKMQLDYPTHLKASGMDLQYMRPENN